MLDFAPADGHSASTNVPVARLNMASVLILGRNEPLKKERPKWKSEYPMTEGQLRSKRDEFWDTAPAFDGRKEIWDALRAAALAAECNDLELAQAIVDGACITLPHGMKAPECTPTQTRAQLLKYGKSAP